MPREPFLRLIEANRVDQRVVRYETWEQLLGYCALSANPVGELVLGVFGNASAERIALSDRICTALQLAEHWQDVAEDFARGRIYLPAADRARFGCEEDELAGVGHRAEAEHGAQAGRGAAGHRAEAEHGAQARRGAAGDHAEAEHGAQARRGAAGDHAEAGDGAQARRGAAEDHAEAGDGAQAAGGAQAGRGAGASWRLRGLLAFEVARTRALLAQGLPLLDTLRGRERLAVAAFAGGARAALEAIERSGYEVLAGAPRASRARRLVVTAALLAGRGR